MRFSIPKDYFDNPTPPRLFLCTPSRKRIGEIPAYDANLNVKWNSYSELTFTVDRKYTDVLTGECISNPIFDKVEGLRCVEVEGFGMFIIQDPDAQYADKDSKTITCFSIEYMTASKYIDNLYVNNGEVDSIEVTYEAQKYGGYATKDDMYKLAKYDQYKASESYYHRVYTDSKHYDYEQIQIENEETYHNHFGPEINPEDILYIHGYENVSFYNPYTPELSLLHIIFSYIPEWKIGNVDYDLWHKERKIEESRVSIYDLMTNTVCDLFECVIIWNTLDGTVDFKVEENNGLTDDEVVNPDWDTDVYISKDNLATEMNVKYSTDDIKTKLKVTGADDLSIREANLGKNYIINLDFYHNADWMDQDVFEAYDRYKAAVNANKELYTDSVQRWVDAYNKWNDLQNAIPYDKNIVLVGDEFKKLYCLYAPIDTAYINTQITDDNIGDVFDNLYSDSQCQQVIDKTQLSDLDTFVVQGFKFIFKTANNKFECTQNEMLANLPALVDQLNLYHVDEDLTGNSVDNILLRLRDLDANVATIRIYDPKRSVATETYDAQAQYYTRSETFSGSGVYKYTKVRIKNATEFNTRKSQLYSNNYKIQVVVINASTGLPSSPYEYNPREWILGNLNTSYRLSYLNGFKVQSIGTIGAYLVLAKMKNQKLQLSSMELDCLKKNRILILRYFKRRQRRCGLRKSINASHQVLNLITAMSQRVPDGLIQKTLSYIRELMHQYLAHFLSAGR